MKYICFVGTYDTNMHVCMSTHTLICICICDTNMHVCMSTHIYMYLYICDTSMCDTNIICIYICIFVYIYAFVTLICMCANMHYIDILVSYIYISII